MSKPYTVIIHMLVEYIAPVIANDEEGAERIGWEMMSNDPHLKDLTIKS